MSLQLGESPDYYRVLGLESGASENEIKQAYKKLAVKTHPDKNSGSDENFKLVGEAYNVLSNAVERQKYDSSQLEAKMSRKTVTAPAVRRKDPNILFYDAARNGDVAGLASGFKCGARVQWRNPADEGRTALQLRRCHQDGRKADPLRTRAGTSPSDAESAGAAVANATRRRAACG